MSKLAKAFDAASTALKKTLADGDFDLNKAGHDAMHHHALHAEAAARAGKYDEAKQHRFMQMRHGVENARSKSFPDMRQSLSSCMDHSSREAQDELSGAESAGGWAGGYSSRDPKKKHATQKHFEGGGGFVPHAHDKSFKEDYKGAKDGPKTGKK